MENEGARIKLNVPVVVILVLAALIALAGYVYWSNRPAGVESSTESATSVSEAELERTSSGAGIEVTVIFLNPLLKPEETDNMLIFRVMIDTHFGDLMGHDLAKLAELRTGDGVVVTEGFIWEPESDTSHHRRGLLKLPATLEGAPLIGPETEFIELELREIGVPSRTFRWELKGAESGP
jgi:hypothetical protein